MKIDLDVIAEKMIEKGHTRKKMDALEFENWTSDLVDILEREYDLETCIRGAIIDR